jgi:hypothetical protein
LVIDRERNVRSLRPRAVPAISESSACIYESKQHSQLLMIVFARLRLRMELAGKWCLPRRRVCDVHVFNLERTNKTVRAC